ncbi:uncharacterized protein LOC107016410 [Solanum pennellii]|uniref:Uncharacterized protein LOC107016410 n=1 Tax=Solanum pennellii TaxID=28526 RepID=A0ABM1V8U0_SOLPN|nr:uncharacterized protein LOC107016410 [Solanum pennellii]
MENINNSLPTRYLLKIESFSLLSENGISKYESNEFESGGFNWKMIIHPNGDGDGDGDETGHISIYLAVIGTSLLNTVCEVNASFSFLIFDQIHDNFTVMKGMERRFRNIKNEWGFSKCISHETFKDPSNGYLVDDKCIFGVDVYVIKKQGIGECMSLLNDTEPYKHEWKITEFSKLNEEAYSEEFTVGDYRWKLSLCLGGDSRQNGKDIYVFLKSVDAKGFDRQKRVQAEFIISLKNQIGGEHHKLCGCAHWYSATSSGRGWSSFMRCCEFNDPKKGFLIEDCCIVEAEVYKHGKEDEEKGRLVLEAMTVARVNWNTEMDCLKVQLLKQHYQRDQVRSGKLQDALLI